MERGLMMVLHSAIIAVILYLFMVYAMKTRPNVAENRSILFGALALVYMILFGHGRPTRLNNVL